GGELNTSLFSALSSDPALIISVADYPELNFENTTVPNLIENFDYMGTQISGASLGDEVFYDGVIYGSLLRDNRTQYGNPNDLIYIHTGTSISTISPVMTVEVKNGDSVIDVHYTRKGYSVTSSNP